MKPKIILEISDGILEAVYANTDIEYVLIDHDVLENDPDAILDISEPDKVVEGSNYSGLYPTSPETYDEIIVEELKRLDAEE